MWAQVVLAVVVVFVLISGIVGAVTDDQSGHATSATTVSRATSTTNPTAPAISAAAATSAAPASTAAPATTAAATTSSTLPATTVPTTVPTTVAPPATTAAPPVPTTPRTCNTTPESDKFDSNRQDLYPGRPGVSGDDHEATVGDCVRIAGLTGYVLGAQLVEEQFIGPVLEVTVMIHNRASDQQSYNEFDWAIQNDQGQIHGPAIAAPHDPLGSGSLVQGGEVTGTVPFVGEHGHSYYILWSPDVLSSDRGVWRIDVP